jgi:putative hydrolase of the HAD superfamily
MRCDAVIFDLFGTLVPRFSLSLHQRVLATMAALLRVPAERFADAWAAAYEDRGTGRATES